MPADGTRRVSLAATEADAGVRLDQFVAARAPDLSPAQAQRLIREGHVALSSGTAKASLIVTPGLVVDVSIPAPAPATPIPEAIPVDVLYDDDDLLVIVKPAGMVVHPGAGHRTGTLVNALLHQARRLSAVGGAERPGIVHRLDRGTSGVMVIARHDRAHRHLSAQFHDRDVVKEYLTLVWGAPRAGQTIATSIGRDPKHRQKISSRARRGRRAVTTILTVESFGGVSLVRVRIATGRTHQIRVHLSEAGHPVVGDALYGGVRRKLPPRLAPLARLDRPFLHAARLSFTHPTTGERLSFEAPLPPDLSDMVARVRRARPESEEHPA
jgi:23S rRNA pseudouridine1911/1915/1917 synthase